MPFSVTSKSLREQRAKLVPTIRQMSDKIAAENRDFTAEEKESWEKVNADYNALTRRIEISEAADRVEADQRQPIGLDDIGRGPVRHEQAVGGDGATADIEHTRALALQGWFAWQLGRPVSDQQEAAARSVRLRLDRPQLDFQTYSTEQAARFQRAYRTMHPSRVGAYLRSDGFHREMRATLSSQGGPSGAYLVPPETLIRELEINMLAYGGMRQAAETMVTTSGERMSWPTADDTTNKGVQLGENTSIGNSVDPVFAKVFWDAYKFSSTPILVPYELLEDSAFNLVSVLGEMLGIRLGRITNDKYTTGTGAATAKGIVTAATQFAAASSTALAWDDVFGLVHSVDPAYRTADASFMGHDNTVLTIRKLKDATGRYLWEPGLDVGTPDRILGYTWVVNQSMDSTIASTKNSLLFGQISKYKIRRVNGMRLYRLQERYRDTDQDAFLAFIREDGNLLTAGTPPVKVLHHT